MAGETLRVAEVSVIALAALLVCPPLLILAVIVVVPAVAVAGVVALIACVIALPLYVVRHVRRHHAEHATSRAMTAITLRRRSACSGSTISRPATSRRCSTWRR